MACNCDLHSIHTEKKLFCSIIFCVSAALKAGKGTKERGARRRGKFDKREMHFFEGVICWLNAQKAGTKKKNKKHKRIEEENEQFFCECAILGKYNAILSMSG